MIIMICKIPKIDQLDDDEISRLSDELVTQMKRSKECHESAKKYVIDAVKDIGVVVMDISEVDRYQKDIKKSPVIITVGGDGTVLAAQQYIENGVIVPINSDHDRSQGFLTKWDLRYSFDIDINQQIHSVAYDAMEYGPEDGGDEKISRLAVNGVPFLNEVLFTNGNPAAMSEYIIKCPNRGIEERQKSSGVIVSTAIGSTGIIQSAGAHPIPADSKRSLFKVREPYHGRGRLFELENWFGENDELELIPTTRDMKMYLDGSHHVIETKIGESLIIKPYAPLNVACQPDPHGGW